MDPREHSGYQTRIRWYLVVIRHDLVMSRGPFAKRKGVRALREVLDSVNDIEVNAVRDR